jgi:serine/threonine protein kinase
VAELLSERYELVHKISDGVVAAIWRGNLRADAGFVRPVAIRVLREPWDRDPAIWSAWARFASELGQTPSAHIEQWIDLVVRGNRAFIVSEWIEGVSVRRWMQAYTREDRKVPWPLATAITIEVLRGLYDARAWHGGIDTRSARIARTGIVKLTRFGAAAALSSVHDPRELEEMGIERPAPEIAAGQPRTTTTDVFSVGALLFEMLTGKPPYDDRMGDARDAQLISGEIPDLSALRDDVPPLLVALIETALRADPSTRFASPDAMIRGLSQLLKSTTERSDSFALAESVSAAADRPAAKPAGLLEQATMHVELSEVTVLPTISYEEGARRDAEGDKPRRYQFTPKERRASAAAEQARGLKPAPQHLTAQESEALPLLLTRRAQEMARGATPTPLGIGAAKTEFLDADQLEQVKIPGSEKRDEKNKGLGVRAQKTELLDADQIDRLTLPPEDE